MENRTIDAKWERLTTLLAPFHQQALATARRLCRSAADGDDLYQEAVLRAFDKLHTLRDESRFRSWFFAAMLSRHRNRFRRVFWKRQVPMDEVFRDGHEPVGEDGTQWAEAMQGAGRATEALSALDAVQREAIVLFEINGYTIEEIADMQRCSRSAVKSRLSRGRRKLRSFYERRGWTNDAASPSRDARSGAANDAVGSDHLPTRPRLDALRTTARVPRFAITPPFGTGGKERAHE